MMTIWKPEFALFVEMIFHIAGIKTAGIAVMNAIMKTRKIEPWI